MRVPNLPDLELTKYLNEWERELERIKKDTVSAVTGNRAVLLISPSRKIFELKVDDAGGLSVTQIAGAGTLRA